ncbi:MMPL family transporter [Streptomyces sp. ms191]|uniref:MMPL family transporter n=1 Tax=Streptomyces sp. ms191 TaxID=1827978 RepID=UPI0011CD9EE0|nr:MMPL family transporter [Streptomyces sp. ms191]TXS22727.1 MMPL family transporter [Streptomyces sp. ms191]
MTVTRDSDPPVTRRRGSVFERLAALSYRRRWTAVVLWIVVVAAATGASTAVGSAYHNDFSLPGTDAQAARTVLERHGSGQADATLQIVVEDARGIRDATVTARVEGLLDRVALLPGVSDVRSPYEDGAAVSRDGTVGYATVTLDEEAENTDRAQVLKIVETVRAAQGDGLAAAVGGEAARGAEEGGGGAAEGAGMLGALVVLVFLFGSLVAASLPVITAVFAVAASIGLIALASHLADVADFTPPIMMLVGLGVGMDYALLIFSRYRGELLAGAEPEQAARTALDAAGRTVFFAGCTVIIALTGLVALGLGSLQGVALAVALTVLVTMAASLTLLPALLGVFGGRIRRQVARRAARSVRVEGAGWRRWAAGVQRRPWAALLLSLAALGALAAPALDMRLGFADAGNDAPAKSSRQAYDLLAEGFGPGFSGPLIVVVDGGAAPGTGGDAGADVAATAGELRRLLDGTDGIAATTPPIPAGDPAVSTVIAFPDSAPQAAATSELVDRLRAEVLPPLERTSGADLLVGGPTAATEDFASTVSARMPLFVSLVVGLSAVLLLLVFRSVLIPVKAALLNLVSIGAALGVITLVFQHGWFGVQPGPIEAFIPVMIFAIVFGLSMDYEVFLLSRIHEEWQRTRDPQGAVREGLAATGRVITAAAAIMIVVFAAFVLSPDRMLQQFGLGLAVAILLDAVVIRCLIVPAVMQLLGRRAWWLPAPLRRILPEVRLERD